MSGGLQCKRREELWTGDWLDTRGREGAVQLESLTVVHKKLHVGPQVLHWCCTGVCGTG